MSNGNGKLCYVQYLSARIPKPCNELPPDQRHELPGQGGLKDTTTMAKVTIVALLAGAVVYGTSDNPTMSLAAGGIAGVASYFFLSSTIDTITGKKSRRPINE